MPMLDRDAKRLKDMCHIHRNRELPKDICEKWETVWNLLVTSTAAKSGLPKEMLVAVIASTDHTLTLERSPEGAETWLFDGKDLTADPKEEAKRLAEEKAAKEAAKVKKEPAPKG